ncbi:hypothetical protein KP509_04G112500 [Ceratopteris richardii]|uniref:PORR domain-containing protein n=2 Tax=Ceratopteris richardii TaxID=49495 RepID=A0A8T2V401_CERRI|nr:hypothetical protein KP509_04G112500 [Ceratopteris richardii]KAH7440555.1 hypothetical protein KP509_04G112500 [Ceratopteris richardii]
MARRILWEASFGCLHRHCFAHVLRNPELYGNISIQKQFFREFNFSTPRFKIKIKKDRPLDGVAEKVKELHPVMVLRDLILRFPKKAIPFRIISLKRRELGLKMSDSKVEALMKRYPNAFEFFIHPDDKEQWCKLTPHLLDLVKEEKHIYAQQEPFIVEKLRKLLMLAKGHCIAMEKLLSAAKFFGFPNDFPVTVIAKYPQYFCILNRNKRHQVLKLMEWDESLAITEFEKKAKTNAKEKGLGEIETRGKPLAFKMKYSAGMQIKKKVLEKVEKWQKLPYVCPYQQVDWVDDGSVLAERKVAALLHEVLSLTIEKKILIEVIGAFREEFDLPQRVARAFNRFPGIFYISLKGNVHTVFLREAYNKRHLLEEHPLITLKWKYHKMIQDGPRLRSMGFKATNIVENVAKVPLRSLEPNELIINDDLSSDEIESADEFVFTDSEEDIQQET